MKKSILLNLSFKYLLHQRKKGAFIILVLALSLVSFVGLNNTKVNMINTFVRQVITKTGTQHCIYKNPSIEVLYNLENSSIIADYGKSYYYGKSQKSEKGSLNIVYFDNYYRASSPLDLELISGVYPHTVNEIALPREYVESMSLNINDKFTIEFYKRSNGKMALVEETFRLVGILEHSAESSYNDQYYALVSSKAVSESDIREIAISFEDEKNINKKVDELVETYSINRSDIYINNAYKIIQNDNWVIRSSFFAVESMIALITILIVYNIMNAYFKNRYKDFIMLRSIGFKVSKLIFVITLEISVYILLSIITGSIVGWLLSDYISITILTSMLSNDVSIYLDYIVPSYRTFIEPIILMLVTILVVVIPILLKISKMPPTNIINESINKIYFDSKSFSNKLANFIRNKFKKYGYKNFIRNRRKTVGTILLMSLISLLLSLSIISILDFSKNIFSNGKMYDYKIEKFNLSYYDKPTRGISESDIEFFKSNYPNLKVSEYKIKSLLSYHPVSEFNKESMIYIKDSYMIDMNTKTRDDIDISSLSYLAYGVNNVNDYIDDKKLLNDSRPKIILEKTFKELLDLNVGELLTLTYYGHEAKKYIELECLIGGYEINAPVNVGFLTGQGFLIMDLSVLNEFTKSSGYDRVDVSLNKSTDELESIEHDLRLIAELNENSNYFSYLEETKQFEKEKRDLIILGILFMSVIITLCLSNVFNNLISNILFRKHEIICLNKIGIPVSGISRSIKYEVWLYGVVSSVLSFILLLFNLMMSSIVNLRGVHILSFTVINLIIIYSCILVSSYSVKRILKNS